MKKTLHEQYLEKTQELLDRLTDQAVKECVDIAKSMGLEARVNISFKAEHTTRPAQPTAEEVYDAILGAWKCHR
jgi:uncharacterized protein YbjQ (UPF0145 family)